MVPIDEIAKGDWASKGDPAGAPVKSSTNIFLLTLNCIIS